MLDLLHGIAYAARIRFYTFRFGLAGRAIAAGKCPNCGQAGGYCGPVCSTYDSTPDELVTFTGSNGQHVVAFSMFTDEVDWWCSCGLIAGHPNRTRQDADADVVLVHQVQDEITIAPTHSGGERR